jgi:hypothetical protein
MQIFDFRAFRNDPVTGKKIIDIDDFSVLRLGARPENFHEFRILYRNFSAYFVAASDIQLDNFGNGIGFSWHANYIKFKDAAAENRSDAKQLKGSIVERVRRFLTAYCPGLRIYPLVNYSESHIFTAWNN